jgi:hypothetical protein
MEAEDYEVKCLPLLNPFNYRSIANSIFEQICKELVRFLSSIDGSGETLSEALVSIQLLAGHAKLMPSSSI